MRFHVLGVSHSKTHRDYSADAFSQKARLLCKLLHDRGHTVTHYGTAGSDPVCTENVEVLSEVTFRQTHGDDWSQGFNDKFDTPANLEFVARATEELRKRVQPYDFICITYGLNHKPITDAVGKGIVVESGIGYEHTYAPHRVFESYAWMAYVYGRENKMLTPSLYDAVIPNYYDLADYPQAHEIVPHRDRGNYFFMIARPTVLKGWEIAYRVCEELNVPLYTAGQGVPPYSHKHLGVVSIAERRMWMMSAKATFVPTMYWEPFGGTVVESLLCGTPVIATDMGAFPETVDHGRVGYRIRTLEQAIWAARNITRISPMECHLYAMKRYSLDRIADMYEEYFGMLDRLYRDPDGWYGKYPERRELSWLTRAA